MGVTALPINASAGSPAYSARQTRQAFAALMMGSSGPLRTRSGFRPGGAPAVSVDASNWSVGVFSAVVDAGMSTVQGPYLVASDATETGAMTPADGTFARKDILYVQVDDADEDSTGQRRARVLYLAGTAGSSPSAPATPARSLLVGTIDVPKVGGGAPSFTAANRYTVAAGGILTTYAANDPPSSERWPGQVFARADLHQLWYSTGPTLIKIFDGSAPALDPIEVVQAANDTTASGTYVPGTLHGTSFVAPPSGKVQVVVSGWLGSNAVLVSTGVNPRSYMSTYVRAGSTVGSGADVLTPSDDRAAAYFNASSTAGFKYSWVNLSHLVTGLTPGNTYNVVSVYRDNGGGASAAVNKRRMIVKGA